MVRSQGHRWLSSQGSEPVVRQERSLDLRVSTWSEFQLRVFERLPGCADDYRFVFPATILGDSGRLVPGIRVFQELDAAELVGEFRSYSFRRGLSTTSYDCTLAMADRIGAQDCCGDLLLHGAIRLSVQVAVEHESHATHVSVRRAWCLTGECENGDPFPGVHPEYMDLMDALVAAHGSP